MSVSDILTELSYEEGDIGQHGNAVGKALAELKALMESTVPPKRKPSEAVEGTSIIDTDGKRYTAENFGFNEAREETLADIDRIFK